MACSFELLKESVPSVSFIAFIVGGWGMHTHVTMLEVEAIAIVWAEQVLNYICNHEVKF